MKKHLLLLVLFIAFQKQYAQVMFCPPGAEWHYNFKLYVVVNSAGYKLTYPNIAIKYKKDSLLSGEHVKVLAHKYFYTASCSNEIDETYIKQKGDTVFMKNKYTLDHWEILYNFATPAGGSWITQTWFSASDPASTYTVSVDSVVSISINNQVLKRLFVKYNGEINMGFSGTSTLNSTGIITEKIGTSDYLFYFNSADCDGPSFNNFLCYQDTDLGVYQSSEKPCNYYTNIYTTALEESEIVQKLFVYPNPGSDVLNINLVQDQPSRNCEIVLVDVLGKRILNHELPIQNQKTELNISELKKGIYSLQMFEEGKLIATKKIIKD